MKASLQRNVYEFSDFSLDRGTQALTHSGKRIPLSPKATQLLLILLDNAPNVVSRESLRDALWSDSTYIEFEGALNACVRQTRAALHDTASDSRFIETLSKRGYRFSAELPKSTTRRSGFAVALVAMIAILTVIFLARSVEPANPETLVVLPVASDAEVSLDPIAAYAIAMITSEYLADLDPHRLAVVNSQSLRQLADQDWKLSQLRSPDYVVRPTIAKRGSTFVLSASLLRTHSGEVLSAFTEELDVDMTTVHRRAPEIIARWLTGVLALPNDYAHMPTTSDRDTTINNQLVTASWYLESGDHTSIKRSLEQFDQVLANASDNIWALEGKITALSKIAHYYDPDYPPEKAYAELEQLANDMLDRGIHSAKTYQALGFIRLYRDWDVSAALNHIEAALLIAPNDANSHSLYASVRAASGDTSGAVSSAEMAERLDPATMAVRSDRCWFLILDGRFQDAAEVCSSTLELVPNEGNSTVAYAQALFLLGESQAALDVMIDAIRRIDAESFGRGKALPTSWQELGCIRSSKILAGGNKTGVSHHQLARYLAQCGKHAEALAQLSLSVEARETPALFLRYAQDFKIYHDDLAFEQLMQRLP